MTTPPPTLRRGARDPGVTPWQTALETLGYPLGPHGIDGQFGPATEGATKRLQSDLGLPPTGVVDGPTRRLAALELVERSASLALAAELIA